MTSDEREQADQHVVDEFSHFMERYQDRLTTENLRLIERYVKGELRIHVHLRGAEEYCAIFDGKDRLQRPVFEGCSARIVAPSIIAPGTAPVVEAP